MQVAVTNRTSKKQRELLNFIDGFIKGHGYGPSYREVMRALNYRSVSTVAIHINNLIKKGHLTKRDHSARSLSVVSAEEAPAVAVRPINKTQQKWLIDQVMHRFDLYDIKPDEKLYDELCILTGTLAVLGIDEAASAAKSRLNQLLVYRER